MADKEKKPKDKKEDKDKKGDKSKIEEDSTNRTVLKDKPKLEAGSVPQDVGDIQGSPTKRKEKECIHHKQKFVYYCEGCEEPICEQCTVLGPHNNQLHRINTLGEAFKSRAFAIHQIVSGSLILKRDQLIAQVHRVDYRVEEIRHIKTIIERDIRGQFGGILERLTQAEGVKLAILQHDISILQKEIDKINDIVNVVNELTLEKGDPVDFLLRSKHLTDTIEFTIAKPFKEEIPVEAYDLPKELAGQRDKIEKMRVVQEILEMKDLVIFELLKKFNVAEEKLASDMTKTAQVEINEWAKLTDKFALELRKYHLICFYCGTPMNEKNVNFLCDSNNRSQLAVGFGFTVDAPERGWHGSRRHYFSKPKPELIKAGQVNSAGVAVLEHIKRNEADSELYKAKYQMFLEVLLAKVRKYCTEKDIKVEKLFTDHDKMKNGVINHIAFTYLLHEYCAVDLIEIDKLKTILDPHNTNVIHYTELVKMINDPKYLFVFQAAHR